MEEFQDKVVDSPNERVTTQDEGVERGGERRRSVGAEGGGGGGKGGRAASDRVADDFERHQEGRACRYALFASSRDAKRFWSISFLTKKVAMSNTGKRFYLYAIPHVACSCKNICKRKDLTIYCIV